MILELFSFNKRRNSTKIPTSQGVQVTVDLKHETDFDTPTFLLFTDPRSYNYCKWNNSYYYINSHRYVRTGIYEISCTIDSLATERDNIMSSTQFVIRSSVSPDYTIIDNFYPAFYKPEVIQTPGSGITFSDTGSYVLAVKTEDGIKYYGISAGDLNALFRTLMTAKQEDLWSYITDLAITLLPGFLNVTDYIIACRWVPFLVQAGQGEEDIYLGYWNSGIRGNLYNKTLQMGVAGMGFGLHPYTGAKEFMNCSQYYQVTVFVPGCGEMPIDIAKCKPSSGLYVEFKIDVLGNVSGCISSDNKIIQRFSGSVGRDVPISSADGVGSGLAGIGGGVTALVTATAGALTGGIGGVALAGLIAGGIGAIGSGIANTVPDINTTGALSSYFVPPGSNNFYVTEYKYDITEQNGAINGYPCMKTLTLSTSGYYQVKDPQVDFANDLKIKEDIIQYMAGGFYVE
ncbi:MAG: hypothetical protein J6R32_11290 [Bacteroidales bacterium]|nr:hypothetical protein [Bacteroidales bacterium]